MKQIDEILARAVITLTIYHRVHLEHEDQSDRLYSLSERKEIRKEMRDWLFKRGYERYMTKKEKLLFNVEIGQKESEELNPLTWQIEAVTPCLWAIGLIGTPFSYDKDRDFDLRDILNTTKDHSREAFIAKSKIRGIEEIMFYREVAMLWHWRFREAWNNKKEKPPYFSSINAQDSIIKIFGEEYSKYFSKIPFTPSHDFKIRSRSINELQPKKLRDLMECAIWRHHAFEWMTGDDDWDNTDTST